MSLVAGLHSTPSPRDFLPKPWRAGTFPGFIEAGGTSLRAGTLRKCQMTLQNTLRAEYHRSFDLPFPGKWICYIGGLLGVFKRTAALCVVDDFGNLVGVE